MKNGYVTMVGTLLGVALSVLPAVGAQSGWQWMAPQRVSSMLKEGSGLWLVDVRGESPFADEHAEGAVNIPAPVLATKRLPKEKIIVLVDDSLGLRTGRAAAEVLLKNGYGKVFLLEGGMSAWKDEKYPVAGEGTRRPFQRVMPDEVAWALENRISVRIFDLRDKEERSRGAVPQAQAVEGKTLAERLEKVKLAVAGGEKNGLAGKLERTVPTVLVFPTSADSRTLLARTFKGVAGDIRYMDGGYAAWAAKADKNVKMGGSCPTCPVGTTGGNK